MRLHGKVKTEIRDVFAIIISPQCDADNNRNTAHGV